MRILLTALLLAALAVATAVTVGVFPYYDVKSGDSLTRMLVATGALWLLFGLALVALRRVPVRAAVVLILIGSVTVGGAALVGPPNTSTDSARYAWDGIVQNAGVSPYDYVPADPTLEELRPDWLFPPATIDDAGDASCDGERILTSTEVGTGEVLCTAINRATVPTIYPPTAELFFAGVRLISGPSPEYWPLQVTGLLMSLGITGILLRALHNRGLNPRWAALWAWCPLVATEGITNSHIDLLGGLLILVATLLVTHGRRFTGGIALGAAIAVKLIPVIAAPALLRRQPWKVIVAAILTFLVLYVPYIVASGIGVLGYLPGYLSEEGYSSGSRFILLSDFRSRCSRDHRRRRPDRDHGRPRLVEDGSGGPLAGAARDDRRHPSRRHPPLPLVRAVARAVHRNDREMGMARRSPRAHRASVESLCRPGPVLSSPRDRAHRRRVGPPGRSGGGAATRPLVETPVQEGQGDREPVSNLCGW